MNVTVRSPAHIVTIDKGAKTTVVRLGAPARETVTIRQTDRKTVTVTRGITSSVSVTTAPDVVTVGARARETVSVRAAATAIGGGGTGDVIGPALATDNAVARFNGGSGKSIQNSLLVVDDAGNATLPGTVDGRDVAADGTAQDAHIVSLSNPHSVSLEQARFQDNVLSGSIDMGDSQINELAEPTADQDAVTRFYSDRPHLRETRRSDVESEFTDFGIFAEGLVAIAAGAGAINGSAAGVDKVNHPGIWCLETGSTAAGRVFLIGSSTRGYNVGGAGITRVGVIVKTGVFLSTALERYVDRVGFLSISLPNTVLEGIGFEYTDNENSGRWQGICEDGLGETSRDLTITVAAETWYRLELEINAAANSVQFFIDGIARGAPVTTNIPSGTAFNLFANFHIMKLIGTGNRSFYVDKYYIDQGVTR